jgi:beta-glucosidase
MIYLDPSRSVSERIADLLGRMDAAEKVGQMLQLDAREDLHDAVLRRMAGSILHASPARLLEAHALVAQTRWRIPLLVAEDCIHGHSFWEGATIFPTQLAMAASWNPELVERAARATAVEAAATGIHWTFSPVLCVSRDLRWGRVGETFGEDMHLIGELGAAMVRGYQGAGLTDPTSVLATAKHFAGYSETQGGRDASEADLSQRKLRSWFLPAFERVLRDGCGSVMLGYQTVDGVPITTNRWLLTDVLRGEWGYEGTLVTDWDNVGRMVWEQQVQPDIVHAAAAAILAGNDLVMTTPTFFEGALGAIERGLVGIESIDAAVARVLRRKFDLGLFENPRLPDQERIALAVGAREHAETNLELARRCVVLLQNDGVLPLDATAKSGPRRIAVLGPLSDDAQTQLGDWAGGSGQAGWLDGQPRELISTVLDGVRELAPDGCLVTHDRGAEILLRESETTGSFFDDGQPRPTGIVAAPVDAALLAAAVESAAAADVAVVVVGDRIELVGEARSTATLELLGAQIALLDAVAATGTPMVVVLMASKPLVLPPAAAAAAAVIWIASPGMAGGRAVAEVVFGVVEPSGRLPISFAHHVGQQPTYYNQIRGQHGDRYADLTQEPAFAFGFGLSYSHVEYGQPRLDRTRLSVEDTLIARLELANVGDRRVIETVQAYVHDLVTSVSWANKELKGFVQVELAPGERREVVIELPVAVASIVDADGRRVVEPGAFELLVGPSSRDVDLRRAAFVVERAGGRDG